MGFWSELKQLGGEIGGAFSNLGSDLKEIGKDTIEEIKDDPKKYLLDSAKDIASGAASLAVGAANFALKEVPNAAFKSMCDMEDYYRTGKLSPEQSNEHIEKRKSAFEREENLIERLIEGASEFNEESDLKKASDFLARLEESLQRFNWFLKLPDFGLELDQLEASRQQSSAAKDTIINLRALLQEIKFNMENKK